MCQVNDVLFGDGGKVLEVFFTKADRAVASVFGEHWQAVGALRNAPRLVPLITAIGASFALQYTFRGLYGAEFRAYPTVNALRGLVNVFGFEVPLVQLVVLGAAIVLMVILWLFVERTKMGMAMRAVSEDKDTARLMGIDIDKVIVTTFAIGGALAAVARRVRHS